VHPTVFKFIFGFCVGYLVCGFHDLLQIDVKIFSFGVFSTLLWPSLLLFFNDSCRSGHIFPGSFNFSQVLFEFRIGLLLVSSVTLIWTVVRIFLFIRIKRCNYRSSSLVPPTAVVAVVRSSLFSNDSISPWYPSHDRSSRFRDFSSNGIEVFNISLRLMTSSTFSIIREVMNFVCHPVFLQIIDVWGLRNLNFVFSFILSFKWL
jgi:hypothetical protein